MKQGTIYELLNMTTRQQEEFDGLAKEVEAMFTQKKIKDIEIGMRLVSEPETMYLYLKFVKINNQVLPVEFNKMTKESYEKKIQKSTN